MRLSPSKPNKTFLLVLLTLILLSLTACDKAAEQKVSTPIKYSEFSALSSDRKKEVFSKLNGQEIYDLVLDSDENWPVTAYDRITPENAKETIILFDNNGDLHFNLAWPSYGGFLTETIASLGDLSGTVDVSRDGGDGGYSMSYGRNADGSYPNDSERSVPKSSATVRVGTMDIDQYKTVVDIVTNGKDDASRIRELVALGYSEDIGLRFINDQSKWLTRDEVAGPNNIADGAALAGHAVDGRYGYYGVTAPWKAGDLDLSGGGGQINPIFSWGTLCESGIIYDTGTAEIN